MDTASSTHPAASRLGWAIAATLALAIAALLITIGLASTTQTAATQQDTIVPATTKESDRGTGDSCALRLDRRGGFIEGLGPANRCGDPDRTPRTGGRLP